MGSTGLRTSNHVQPSPIGPTLIAKTVMRMPFGKYLDIEVGQLPTDYLEWLDENVDLYGRLRQAVERELRNRRTYWRKQAAEPPPPVDSVSVRVERGDEALFREMIDAGFKALARKHHPDVGGDTTMMQRINCVAERLRQQLKP